MTSCRAVMASVAMADTRAWSTVAALRSFWAKRSVALRPEPAAVGLGAVGALMVVLLRCGVDGTVASLQGPAASLRVVGAGRPFFSGPGGGAPGCRGWTRCRSPVR